MTENFAACMALPLQKSATLLATLHTQQGRSNQKHNMLESEPEQLPSDLWNLQLSRHIHLLQDTVPGAGQCWTQTRRGARPCRLLSAAPWLSTSAGCTSFKITYTELFQPCVVLEMNALAVRCRGPDWWCGSIHCTVKKWQLVENWKVY